MATKKLFEVSIRTAQERGQPPKVLFVLADDENDLQSIGELGERTIVGVVQVDGAVRATGPSRVIGWTRGTAASRAFA